MSCWVGKANRTMQDACICHWSDIQLEVFTIATSLEREIKSIKIEKKEEDASP